MFTFGLLCLLELKTGGRAPVPYELDYFFRQIRTGAWAFISLRHAPPLFATLPLYVYLSIMGPFLVLLMSRIGKGFFILSFLLWLSTQLSLPVRIPILSGVHAFSPLAYQLLFSIGIFIGGKSPKILFTKGLWVTTPLLFLSAVKVWLLPRLAGWHIQIPETWLAPLPFNRSANLQILALFHFALVAYTAAILTRNIQDKLRQHTLLLRILHIVFIRPGRFSLEVFCFGVFYTYFATAWLWRSTAGWESVLAWILSGWLLSIVVAQLAYRIEMNARQLPKAEQTVKNATKT